MGTLSKRPPANSPSCQKDATEAVDVSPQRPVFGEGIPGANHSKVSQFVLASKEGVVFIPFHHLFLEKNEVMIYQSALDFQTYREVMIYIG